jgi:hypothetical protein
MRLQPLVLSLALLGALAGCATASRVMISEPRPAIPLEQVRIYPQMPTGRYVEIALLDASSGGFTYGAQNRNDAVIAKLRQEAASLGANGVVLQAVDEYAGGSGLGIGVGGGGRHVGGGVSVDVAPPRRVARAVAIWVPDAP